MKLASQSSRIAVAAIAAMHAAGLAMAGSTVNLPFDFSDSFYLENGINPAAVVGRPTGNPPASIIDNTENGPDFNNVRILQANAAYDHSGHLIFFYVPGILFENAFLENSAGDEAFQIAEKYKVYEFPRATNPPGAVFPKRQDLIADLSGGYFSNNPLGIWQINLVTFTDAALNTAEGQQTLADLAADNGLDLDGTPLIRTKSEVEMLVDKGLATIFVPPVDGSAGLRWFLCPVIKDPKDGAIAADAFLVVTEGIPAADEFVDAFDCLQQTGDWCDAGGSSSCPSDLSGDGSVDGADLGLLLSGWGSSGTGDLNGDGQTDGSDLGLLLSSWGPCT